MKGTKAIEIIKASRKTHVDWAEYFEKNPTHEQWPENKNIGDAKFHRECITRYDEAIAEVMELMA